MVASRLVSPHQRFWQTIESPVTISSQQFMAIKKLVTLGPSSMSSAVVHSLSRLGVDLFRINLSHTDIDDVEDIIKTTQAWTDVPICLDSEGAQVRNQEMMNESVFFESGTEVNIHPYPVCGDNKNISFSPRSVWDQLKVGDRIRVDFHSMSMKISQVSDSRIVAVVETEGFVGSNKAADLDRPLVLDAITDKDRSAIEIGLNLGVQNFSLSFTSTAEDVHSIRESIGTEANLISKIENIDGMLNLKEILPLVDQILIDRGDLSREIPIAKIPFAQRKIIAVSKTQGVPVFVATNLLESMVSTKSPTRAEVNDVVSTLLMGADGLVLAAETAIGSYPIRAVEMINALIAEHDKWSPESSFVEIINS